MASNGSLLKGKRVMTESYYGTVLNSAEHEHAIILHAIREKYTRFNRRDILSLMASVPAEESNWYVVDAIIAIPWGKDGILQVMEKLPEFLHVRNLRPRISKRRRY